MTKPNEQSALSDLLQKLQIELIVAAKTQVSNGWGETDSVPDHNKLYFVVDGEGWIRVGGDDYYPRPGQLFLAPSHAKVSFSALNNRPYLKYWCHFTVTAGPFDLFQWIGVPLCIDADDAGRMALLFEEMIGWHAQHSVIARLREKALLLDIVCLFLGSVPIRVLQHRSEDMNRLNVIQHFVDSRLHTAISVDRMAEEVHLHPNYFIAYFKKHFGVPPLKYVNRKRADRAKQLLATTSLSVKEIADRTGFKETSHFAKFFRKETSLTPSEYRAAYMT
ncbi:AraC family transcriptional regulator [Paenibacillus arenilitoris]|uniref:AraC family transcriptional regulator n=1 Tax=Paenibacillus arenilitoris TaxID=2772299 RepID=A0A927CU57_9BACL|nr:AraC family transcriptional regulator [Paenibacillus arenilitoris]MBD2872286.1 AraC family transcriptional regulator [Paenibacillus arenilitoris]